MGELQDRLEAEAKRARELTVRVDIFEEVTKWFEEAVRDWENMKNKKVWFDRWLAVKEVIDDEPLEDTV